MANLSVFIVQVSGSDETVQEALRRVPLGWLVEPDVAEPALDLDTPEVKETLDDVLAARAAGYRVDVSRYEPSHEEPEPEVALPGELEATATVPVDQAETGEAEPKWKDVPVPEFTPKTTRRKHKPTEQTKDMHHQQVAKGSAAKHAETPGPVVGGAPKITNLQKILRLVAKQATPFNRFTLLDAVMDEDLASTRDSAYQQVPRLRKQGFLADAEQDGRIVTVLTEAGQAEVRRCPSSAE